MQVSVYVYLRRAYALRGGVQDRDCPRLFHLVEIPSLQSLPPHHPKCSRRTFTPPLPFFPGKSSLSLSSLLSPEASCIAGHYGTCMTLCILPPTVIIPRYKLSISNISCLMDHFVMRAPTRLSMMNNNNNNNNIDDGDSIGKFYTIENVESMKIGNFCMEANLLSVY